MRVATLLRTATLALALTSAVGVFAPAFAGSVSDDQSQAQQTQNSNTGPYDGAADEAAKRAFN